MPKIRLLGILGLLLSGTAVARVPRYTRPDVSVPVKLSDRVTPYAATPVTARPQIDADMVISVAWVGGTVRVEQQAVLEQLIANTPDSEAEEKADYLFRLSEMMAAQHRFWRRKASEMQIQSDATTDAVAKTKLRSESAVAANKAKDFLLRAVKVYKALTENQAFRNYPKLDVALFGYGYTLQAGKYLKEARAVYDSLLKNYPNSKFVPEAHLVFGDYFYEQNQLADAEVRYKQVLKFPKSSVYWYAMYKLGWIHLQLQRYQESLESFFQVVMGTRNDQAQGPLSHAAKFDFVRAYAEIGKADKALPAFQRVDRDAAGEMLEKLAQLYVEQGKLDAARSIHQELMKQTPKSARVCDWQYRIARGMLSMPGANTADKVREIENLVKLSRALDNARTLPMPELQDCRANATAMSGELARGYHNEAQKTKNVETLAFATRLYRTFLDNFPDDPQRIETQSLMAEALWSHAAAEPNDRLQRERWVAASAAFAELAKIDPARATSASRASVLAWMNGHDTAALATGSVPQLTQGKPAPRPLSTEDQQLIDAVAAFASTIRDPRDPELGALRFLEANIYRRANQHDKAAPIFINLVTTHPNESFAEAASVMAIDSLVILQKLDDMLLLADKLAADARYLADKPELTKVIKLVRSRSMRR